MPNPRNAGPNQDGSNSLAKESKVGLAVQWILGVLAVGALDWLTNLNTSSWTGYVGQAGVLAFAWAIAAITAWRKKNS
jgi:hypothetical protein